MLKFWLDRYWQSFSAVGLLVGTLFFAASLTPSLLPRTFVLQGVLSGCAAAVGYGIGVFGLWLWTYLELPGPGPRARKTFGLISAAAAIVVALVFLWKEAEWQNTVRELMQLAPVDGTYPLYMELIAVLVFVVLLALGKLFAMAVVFGSRKSRRFVPKRVSYVVGLVLAAALFWSIIDGVALRYGLRLADSSFRALDEFAEVGVEQPVDPAKTGSAASLIGWKSLGRRGREFISTGPTKDDLAAFWGRETMEPLRVYAGLRSAETAEARAKIALEELKRIGGFDRSTLIIAMPTGTGWLDPSGMDSVEYLHAGDVASVAIQYSYLSSWLSLLVEPGYGSDAAKALFSQVYGHWKNLPKDRRPKLYLHGLSLGAFGSESSMELFEILGDPFHGALWVGPPFPSQNWRSVTGRRNPGSPAWLPQFRDGSVIRFTNQHNALAIPGARWGPMRIVYLQYASDPITFFDPDALYRQPDWMADPRGPDVSPAFRWLPVVTLLQLTLDLATSTTTPMGFGHVYAPEHYIDGWVEVTAPRDLAAEDIARLKRHFRLRR